MTAIVVVNAIAVALVVLGLALVMRLGHLAGGGRFDRTLRRFELHRGGREDRRKLCRAA